MRITTRLIIHCILPMDGIDGEGRIERMSPKGIKKKPSKSFNQDFPTAFYYNYQRVISIIVTSIIYIKIVGKCFCIYSMIQCLMHEHTTHAQSILCFDIIYLQVCSFYYVASLLYINYIAKLRILLRINKFLYIKMKSHTLKYQYFIYFQYPTACYIYQFIQQSSGAISPISFFVDGNMYFPQWAILSCPILTLVHLVVL